MGPLPRADGYSWRGELGAVDIRAVYAACHSARFSGRLRLSDGDVRAEIVFLGGDPVEIEGGDTQRIALWERGEFHARQFIPDFSGVLTEAQAIEGELAGTLPSVLWGWVNEYRLSCDIEIDGAAGRCSVRFRNGHAETAELNGQPELAALARVSSWREGHFRVRLTPLFAAGAELRVDGAMPAARPAGPRDFDFSQSNPLELVPEVRRVESETEQLVLPPPKRRRRAWPWLVAATVVVVGAGLAVLASMRRGPSVASGERERAPERAAALADAAVTPAPADAAVPREDAAVTSEDAAVAREPRAPKPAPATADARVEKLTAKGRQLLIEGHPHTALDVLRKALKLEPRDPNLKVYEQQAQGLLGKSELQIAGRGALFVDGHRFSAPRVLKLSAGPHRVVGAVGVSESSDLVLRRGEKRKLRVR